jgi:hypothetical protein
MEFNPFSRLKFGQPKKKNKATHPEFLFGQIIAKIPHWPKAGHINKGEKKN